MRKEVREMLDFLEQRFGEEKQTFFTKNPVGDSMETIWKNGNIWVDYCEEYDYLEIFGLTATEELMVEALGWNEK